MPAWRYEISLLVLKKKIHSNIFQHLKRNFVSPRGHVISFMSFSLTVLLAASLPAKDHQLDRSSVK